MNRDRAKLIRRIFLVTLASGMLVVALAAGMFAGYKASEEETGLHRYLSWFDQKLKNAATRIIGPAKIGPTTYVTHLLRLDSDVAVVDFDRDLGAHPMSQNGGGLTSFGDDILLLPFDGHVFAASSSDDVRRTRIVAPDNGRESYGKLVSDPAYEGYDINVGYHRYNDIIHVETDDIHALIISYSEFHPADVCYTNTLAALSIEPGVSSIDEVEAGPDDWGILYRTKPCLPLKKKYNAMEGHMAGGIMAFKAPATLYVTSGDYHLDGMRSDPPPIAQDPDAEYGKVLAFNLQSRKTRIVSSGHRNPQGITITPSGQIFEVEHGPRGGDELNLIVEGVNYGWPVESLGTTYAQTSIPGSISFARHDSFVPPQFSWTPSVAPSGVAYVQNFHPAWDGDLVIGSLIGESLFRVRMAKGRPVYSERIKIGLRIRAVHQHTDGRLVLWTDSKQLIFLTGHSPSDLEQSLDRFARMENLSSQMATELESAVLQCAECHSFQVGDNERSPSLARVYGAPIAATSYAGYSAALKGKSGNWTHQNLEAFLLEPQNFAAETKMPPPQIDDPDVLTVLVDFLEAYSLQF